MTLSPASRALPNNRSTVAASASSWPISAPAEPEHRDLHVCAPKGPLLHRRRLERKNRLVMTRLAAKAAVEACKTAAQPLRLWRYLAASMELKPEAFSIGVIDLFSVMLPGAATAAAPDRGATRSAAPASSRLATRRAGAVGDLFFVSYLLGHYVFWVGARNSKWVYDRLRRATRYQQEHASPAKNQPGRARDSSPNGSFDRAQTWRSAKC